MRRRFFPFLGADRRRPTGRASPPPLQSCIDYPSQAAAAPLDHPPIRPPHPPVSSRLVSISPPFPPKTPKPPKNTRKAGGDWRAELAKGDMPVACTFRVAHQGRERSYNVYLPASYDGKKQQSVWMHLHGVYTSEWGGDLKGQYPGEAILCRDACALWDGMAGAKRREGLNPARSDNAIVVYPETAIGDPYRRSVEY